MPLFQKVPLSMYDMIHKSQSLIRQQHAKHYCIVHQIPS